MKCPRCRREIAYEAITCKCGWSARVSMPVTSKPATRPVPLHLANPALREQLDALLKKFRAHAQERLARAPHTSQPLPEVTEGHGVHCFCEKCFPQRVRRRDGQTRVASEAAPERASPKGDDDGKGK